MTKEKDHADYTCLVSELFHCIEDLLPDRHHPLVAFCSDMQMNGGWCLQDSALLMNDCAEFYVDVIHSNQELFQIELKDYMITYSILVKDRKQYSHSCYPKNVRRWLQGTLSRKKKCRVQFCTFLYCWAIGWGKEGIEHKKCQQKLEKICRTNFPDLPEDLGLLSVLWFALESFYRK